MISIDELTFRLNVTRPYDAKMIYSWSVGLIGNKKKESIALMVVQLEDALVERHKLGLFVHHNFYHLLDELRDRAEDPQWRCRIWENSQE